MKILNKKKQYFEVDLILNEAEIQTIVGAIEQLQHYHNMPMEEIGGVRQNIYEGFKKILEK